MPVGSLIIGCDLLPIKPIPSVITFVGDILTQSCRAQIKKHLQSWQVDLVLHDGAPNVGGGQTWTRDAYSQIELVLHSLKLATEFLVQGGTFVTKIFRSQDYIALLWVLKQFFRKVEVTKPVASRQASAEIFAVCLGYLAPKKIDPKLFDPEVVFKRSDTDVEAKKVNVMTAKLETKRNRSGYDTDKQIVHTTATVSEFIKSPNPSDVLATANQLVFDVDAGMYREHPATTPEIIALMEDLKVLGRSDFSQLIRWHKKMRRHNQMLIEEEKRAEAEEARKLAAMTMELEKVQAQGGEGDEDEDVKRDQALQELKQIIEARKLRAKKKKQEQKMKELRRLALNATSKKALQGLGADDILFHLKEVQDDEALNVLRSEDSAEKIRKLVGDEVMERLFDGDDLDKVEEEKQKAKEEVEEEMDSGDDSDAYMRRMEQIMEQKYERYRQKKGIIAKRDKKPLGLPQDKLDEELKKEEEDYMEDGSDGDDDVDYIKKVQDEVAKSRKHTSLVSSSVGVSGNAKDRWFGQDAFQDIDMGLEEEAEKARERAKQREEIRKKELEKKKREMERQDIENAKLGKKRKIDWNSDDENEDDEEEEEEEEEEDDLDDMDEEDFDEDMYGDEDDYDSMYGDEDEDGLEGYYDDEDEDDVSLGDDEEDEEMEFEEEEEEEEDVKPKKKNSISLKGSKGLGEKKSQSSTTTTTTNGKGPTKKQVPLRTYEKDSDDSESDASDSDTEFARKRWEAIDAKGMAAPTRKAFEKTVARSQKEKESKKLAEALRAGSSGVTGGSGVGGSSASGKKMMGKLAFSEEEERKNKIRAAAAIRAAKLASGDVDDIGDNDGVEEVEMSDFSEDSDAQAEILAIGTKMLRRKARTAMIDAAYNKYAQQDHDELPSWFVDDENRHNRAQLPVTKHEVDVIKNYLKAVNARPIKKVAEARARKKMKTLRKLERMKVQANAIVNQDDVNTQEKMKQLEKLYSMTRAKQKMKPQRNYIVSKKGGNSVGFKSKTKGSGKNFVVRVDRRMKKDKRGIKNMKTRQEKAKKLRNKKRVKRSTD